MHRTNIYLTDDQERALDTRARRLGKSRSAVIRDIIDRDLRVMAIDGEVARSLAALADAYHSDIEGLFDSDPDLRIER
jgi:predicted DNA-binding protein